MNLTHSLRIGIAGIAAAACFTGATAAVSHVAVDAATATPASASYYGSEGYNLWDFDNSFDQHTCDEIHFHDSSNDDLLCYFDDHSDLRDWMGERGVIRGLYDHRDGWNSFSYDCHWAEVG